jgi:hypothetical protein
MGEHKRGLLGDALLKKGIDMTGQCLAAKDAGMVFDAFYVVLTAKKEELFYNQPYSTESMSVCKYELALEGLEVSVIRSMRIN